MTVLVLDASALLALYQDEPGGRMVERLLPGCHMGAVNLAEVGSKLGASGVALAEIRDDLAKQDVTLHAFEVDDAAAAVALGLAHARLGLSFGDRACLALAKRLEATALTADRAWGQVHGVPVKLIR